MPMERTITNEMDDVDRLIRDRRERMYQLMDLLAMPEYWKSETEMLDTRRLLHDYEITIKSLELYLDVLERTANARERHLAILRSMGSREN